MLEIRIHGRGGQGAVIAAEILATAFFKDGKSVPTNVDECLVCRACEAQCPEGAIQVIE